MSDSRDSEILHDDRLHEVARILAAGILRLHARAALPADGNLSNSGDQHLAVCPETVLSVTTGVNGFRDLEKGAGT